MISSSIKIMGKVVFFVLVLLNIVFFILLYAPTSFLVSLKHEGVKLIRAELIPEAVVELVSEGDFELETTMALKDGPLESINNHFLEVHRRFFMDEKQQLALNLSLLQFSPDIVGLEAGSQHYYQKSLDHLTAEEWLMLVNFHFIFGG